MDSRGSQYQIRSGIKRGIKVKKHRLKPLATPRSLRHSTVSELLSKAISKGSNKVTEDKFRTKDSGRTSIEKSGSFPGYNSAEVYPDTFLLSSERLRYPEKFVSSQIDKFQSLNLNADDNSDDNVSQDTSYISISSRSIGNKSYRSYLVDSVNEDGLTIKRERTIKELVSEIETCSRLKKIPPAFLPKLSELTPDIFSWDAKMSATSLAKLNELRSLSPPSSPQRGGDSINVAFPSVNIQPCHQPVELLLVKADKRSRKLTHVLELKEKSKESYVQHIDALIKHKFSRTERYKELQRLLSVQKGWIQILRILQFVNSASVKYSKFYESVLDHFKSLSAKKIIAKNIQRWYFNMLHKRYFVILRKRAHGKFFKLIFQLRINVKRRAIKKIVSFLNSLKGQTRVSVVVHRFLLAVRKIQLQIRKFLDCKRARVEGLIIYWNKVETRYIKSVLKRRAESKDIGKNTSFQALKLDTKTRIELDKQNKRWDAIDVKMQASIDKHRLLGNLKMETGSEAIEKLMLPLDLKKPIILEILYAFRKQFYLTIREKLEKLNATRDAFNEVDAVSLLLGKESEVTAKVEKKMQMSMGSVSNIVYQFLLFSRMSFNVFLPHIKELHKKCQTFVVKIPETSKKKGKMLQAVEKSNSTDKMGDGENAGSPRKEGHKLGPSGNTSIDAPKLSSSSSDTALLMAKGNHKSTFGATTIVPDF